MNLPFAGHGPGDNPPTAFGRQIRGKLMKISTTMMVGAALVALAGCNKKTAENNAAAQVEANAENSAENVTAAANNEASNIMNTAENKASAVKNAGENEASAIKNAGENKAAAISNSSSKATENKSK